jgi:hypothetical protein
MGEPNEYQEDIHIDPEQLDVECVRQADDFIKWAERAVKAKRHLDDMKVVLEGMKFELKVVEADLSLEVRANPSIHGLEERVTEKAVESVVQTHKRMRKAHNDMLDAQREVAKAAEGAGLLGAAVDAMEQRKRMLEVLITLHGQSYFAGPSVPRNLPKLYQRDLEMSQRVNVKLKSHARKRGKKRGEV